MLDVKARRNFGNNGHIFAKLINVVGQGLYNVSEDRRLLATNCLEKIGEELALSTRSTQRGGLLCREPAKGALKKVSPADCTEGRLEAGIGSRAARQPRNLGGGLLEALEAGIKAPLRLRECLLSDIQKGIDRKKER